MKSTESVQQLVVVLGMHRSGTSAITRGLQTMGVVLGDRLEPPAEGLNDKGYWEDIDLVALNVEMLKLCGREWHSLEPLQQVDVDLLCDRGYLLRAIELLRSKLSRHTRFGFKDPRTAKMLPFWVRAFATGGFDVRYVLALRNPLSVVKSLVRRDLFDPERSYLLWVDHVVTSLAHAGGQMLIAVDYDILMRDPEGELNRTAAWLGADIDVEELAEYRSEFLDEALRHSQFAPDDVYADVAAHALAREVHAYLVDALAGRVAIAEAAASGRLRQWTDELDRLRPILRLSDKQQRRALDDRREIAKLERWVVDRDQEITKRDQQVAERDQVIVACDREISRQNSQLAERDRELAERDRELAERDRELAERDRELAERDRELAERDRELADRDRRIAERDQQIAEGNQFLSVREQQLESARTQLDELALKVVRLEGEVAQVGEYADQRMRDIGMLRDSLSQMHSSNSWRVTAPMRYVSTNVRRARRMFRLLPDVIARGGSIGGTARKAVRITYREGFAGVRKRLREVETPPLPQVVVEPTPEVRVHCADRFHIIPYYVDPRLDVQESAAPTGLSLAVHLHLFYPDMAATIATRLANIPCAFDLYVSIPQTAEREGLASLLRGMLPRVEQLVVEPVPNRGRDLAPMVVQFGERLSKYAIVGHFHTKKSLHNGNLESWCSELYDHLLGAPGTTGGRLAHLFEALQTRAKIVYPEGRTEFIKDRSGWADNHELARQLLDRYTSLSIEDFPVVEFPEGAMFWARGECLHGLLKLPLSYEDFPPEPIAPDGTLAHALERLILIFASPHDGDCLRLHRGDSIADYRCYESAQDYSDSIVHHDVKVLAYYLPQFHPIPENNAWHGEGFTEWTKVRAANPLFEGHYQQHIPHPDIGYYLLESPDTLRMQAELMRRAGVQGQVFYHYWFGGKLILEEPAQMLLATPDIDMPFCFCWANENWTRRWDGNESEILLAQNYSPDDAQAFIRYLIPFFLDRRYIRVDDRPVLFIYRPSSIPDVRIYLDSWARECGAAGLRAPYVVAVLTRGAAHPGDFGMDAGVERVLHDWTAGGAPEIKDALVSYVPINGSVLSYDDVANYYSAQKAAKDFTYFRSIVPMWDNTARYGSEAYVVHGSCPERFQEWFESLIQYTKHTLPADRRFILVNAWNEWAEGAHMEPDSRYGYAYLNAVGRALSGIPYAEQLNPLRPLSASVRIHLVFPPHFRSLLSDDPALAQRFLHGMARSSIFDHGSVTVDADFDHRPLAAETGVPEDADLVLEFRRIAFFSPVAIQQMVQTAICCPGSVIIPNAYDGDRPLIPVTRNGSVESADAHEAPLVIYPARMPVGGLKNVRMRTDAQCFVAYPNSVASEALAVVTTVIRFHKSGDLELLRNALSCLAAMRNCICLPLIAAQDLSLEQSRALSALLEDFAWHPEYPPQVHYYHTANGHGDLRSKMLNESLRKVETRYAAFLDYDDLVMSHAYEWMVARLSKTGKAVTFGRVFSTTYDGATGQRLVRSRTYEYGYSYDEFVNLNHAPLHSFMLDVTKLDLSRVVYHEDQRYMEDYFMTLQLFTRENGDWDSLRFNRYIGDYIHSIDRSHTLAFTDSVDRDTILKNPEYMLCESRINNLRSQLTACA